MERMAAAEAMKVFEGRADMFVTDFGEALAYVKDGGRAARAVWVMGGMWIRLVEPEGTYLLWLDVSAYGYSKEELSRQLKEEARLWLDEGAMFGPEGEAFLRVNIASPRSVIAEAMERFLRLS